MKTVFGILVIVVVVFLSYVELGTPLGPGFSFGLGSAPRPVSVLSTRKPTGRGGRYGRQQSARTPQPSAPEAPPEATPTTSETYQEINLRGSQEAIPIGTYIEETGRGFIKLEKGRDVVLYRFENVLIGRIADDDILPIYNKRHDIIRIDYNKGGLRIPMNRTEARRWGVFGKYSEFSKRAPPAFLQYRV